MTSHEAFHHWAMTAATIGSMVCLAAFAVGAVVVLIWMLRKGAKQ